MDLKNQVEHVIHETEKQLEEHKEKLPEGDIQAINTAKNELPEAAQGDDTEKIGAVLKTFHENAQELGKLIYTQAQ